MSNKLGVSRSAIWKHMKELEKDGYEIIGVPKKGYQITRFPSKVSENTIQWGLNTKWLGKNLVHKESIESTQILGHQLAIEGSKHGTVIVADTQTAGKGRMERKWYSTNGQGIWMSMILRPTLLPHQAPQITLLAATVLADVIKEQTGIVPSIKWPNDVLINDKKISGILTEMQAEQDCIQYIILGIGININQTIDHLPDDIKEIATSLKIETEKDWNIRDFIQHFLVRFEQVYQLFLDNGFSSVKQSWESYAYKIGQTVTIQTFHKKSQAKLVGIKADGALIIENESGKKETLYSAEIQW